MTGAVATKVKGVVSRAINPANANLRKLLEARVQSARGDESFVLPDELFQAFEMDNMDFNGATCSGYSESGRSCSVSATVNVAALAGFPGILSCEVSAGLELGRGKRTMLVLRRMPASLSGIYRSAQSLGFFQFNGLRWKAKAGVGVEAGIGPPEGIKLSGGSDSDSDAEESSLKLESELTASLALNFGGEFYSAFAEWPDFYEGSYESALRTQFAGLMPEWRKGELKEHAAALLKKISTETSFGSNFAGGLSPKEHWLVSKSKLGSKYKTEELLPLLDAVSLAKSPEMTHYKAQAQEISRRLVAIRDSVTEKADAKLEAVEWLDRYPPVQMPQRTKGGLGRYRANDLKNAIDATLRYPLPDAARTTGRDISQRLATYADPPEPSRELVNRRGQWRGLGRFSLCCLGGGAEVGVEAKAEVKAASVTATAGVSGSAKRAQFRFQCWAETQNVPNSPLVQTQDVCLVYKQIALQAGAEVKAPKLHKELGKDKLYNSLHWNAAIAHWAYPAGDRASADILLLEGSGYCIGISVRFSRLRRQTARSSPDRAGYIQFLAAALGANAQQVESFLASAPFLSDDADSQLPTDAILLEAAFAPTGPMPWRAAKAQPIFAQPSSEDPAILLELDKSLLKFMKSQQKAGQMKLQSISARYRTADFEENSKTMLRFKLGIRPVATIGFHLRSIAEAGFDSVIDLGRWWADPDLDNLSRSDPRQAYNKAVPRVALFHQ